MAFSLTKMRFSQQWGVFIAYNRDLSSMFANKNSDATSDVTLLSFYASKTTVSLDSNVEVRQQPDTHEKVDVSTETLGLREQKHRSNQREIRDWLCEEVRM